MALTQIDTPMLALSDRRPLFGRDPLGLIAGWRAFRTYEALASLDDRELAARGLTRGDVPQRTLAELRRAL
jgi:uncharacterized protein YjiS (DUF1127 family)